MSGTVQSPRAGTPRNERSIPSLDGLRALSISLVILDHAAGTVGFPSWIPEILGDHGYLGVQIFFVISGFLITNLLLAEETFTGKISLGMFYARRTLRIFPPFYCFLAVLLVGNSVGWFEVTARNFWMAATYTMNYAANRAWFTAHIWSLSVEEQFYLVWPFTIRFAGFPRALWIAATVALASPLVCLAIYLFNPRAGTVTTQYFPFVADPIAAGCVLAGIMPWIRANSRASSWLRARAGALVLPLIALLDLGRNHPRIHLAFAETATNLCICYAIGRYTEFPRSTAGRLFNNPTIAFVGKISYSLYLWQQIFVNRYTSGILQTFPVNVAASFACALMSWYLIESPMAGVRKRLHPTLSPISTENSISGL